MGSLWDLGGTCTVALLVKHLSIEVEEGVYMLITSH
jgi:hypothetical protein